MSAVKDGVVGVPVLMLAATTNPRRDDLQQAHIYYLASTYDIADTDQSSRAEPA